VCFDFSLEILSETYIYPGIIQRDIAINMLSKDKGKVLPITGHEGPDGE
jgi:hypothetical protein